MKFLVDHQLPPSLAEFVRTLGHECQHVRDLGLKSDEDVTIWNFARENGWVLISKDVDFFHLATRPDETGNLIWVRLGNCRNRPLLEMFEKFLPEILRTFNEGSRIIEIR